MIDRWNGECCAMNKAMSWDRKCGVRDSEVEAS